MYKKKQSILIVDDSETNIEVLSTLLMDDYEILFSTNGKEALEISIEQLPDLILLDVLMPEIDGYEVGIKLKTDSRTKNIPLIFVTSMDQEEDETKGLNIGAIDYLTKPIRPPIAKARIRNHLELKKYRDILENLSNTDGLTGIANRRRFDESIETEWQRAIRNQNNISLIMIDIDYFKAYNDYYGHLEGDDCLKEVAKCLSQSINRPADLVARYGGEEFVIILPETDMEGVLHVGKRIQENIKKLNISHLASEVSVYITLSMGLVTAKPAIGNPLKDFVKMADEQLYRSKQNGRNQFFSASF